MACLWRTSAVTVSVVFALLLGASAQVDSCASLLDAISDTACFCNNATSLTCPLGDRTGSPEAVTFTVEPCADPVYVLVTVRVSEEFTSQQTFVSDGEVYLVDGSSLSVRIARNVTHLDFEVLLSTSANSSAPLLPRLYISLLPASCMCSSLVSLAANTGHTFLSPTCTTNQASECDGVNCMVLIDGTYYIENIILPCVNAVELVVRNGDQDVIFLTVFNETGRHPLVINGLMLYVDVIINVYNYSMDYAASVEEPFFGLVEIFPIHRIILDRTHCNLPNFTTVPPPPPLMPLPTPGVDSSPTCLSFYEAIREVYAHPLVCGFLGDDCDAGISCTLFLLNLQYNLEVVYVNSAQGLLFNLLNMSGAVLGSGSGFDLTSVALPQPPRASVVFSQRLVAADLSGFQIDLHLTLPNGTRLVRNLLPFSLIALAVEPCQALVQATSDPSTRCAANGDCSGLTCDLGEASSVEEYDVVFEVEKCVDPLIVNVTTYHGGVALHQLRHSDWINLGGGEFLRVNMSRNATDLMFNAYITDSAQSTLQLRPVIPQVLLPLNASVCMCESMAALAALSGHSLVETSCEAHTDCAGITCQLSVVGSTYFIEVDVSACDEIVYVVVRDGDMDILHTSQYNESGMSTITIIPGFPLTLDVTLRPAPFSLFVNARLTTPFLGEAEIVPPHVLSLDRTQCNHRNFVTVSGPLPATLPTQSSTKSDICQALYGVVRDHYMKPFTCYARSPCDTGIRCILEILDTMYSITLSFSRGSTAISLLVEDGMGVSLSYPESAPVQNSNGSTTIVSDVQLSVPQNSNLSLTQTYQPETSTIGFQLDLYVYALDGSRKKDVLISYSDIPTVDSAKTSIGVIAAATAVPLFLLLALIVAVVVTILVVVMMRKRHISKAFDFQPMSHRDLEEKDRENFLAIGKEALPNTGSVGKVESDENGTENGLRDVDLKDRSDPDSVRGHLV